MILVTEHVKAQNWFAVGIDFLIVVVGVFIGIQVSNWNDARRDTTEERRLVTQLLEEVDPAIDSKKDWLDRINPRVEQFRSALETVQLQDEGASLTNLQCQAVSFSHIVVFRASTLPTLEEILSTGGLGVLSDQRARAALMRYKSGVAEVQASYDFIRADFANLIDSYGEALTRTIVASNMQAEMQAEMLVGSAVMPVASTVECQINSIKTDRTLQNRMVSNLARTQALVNNAEVELRLLQEIKSALQKAQK